MSKWVCKISRSGSTLRVALPRALVEAAGWSRINFLELELTEDGAVTIWGLEVGESIKSEGEADRAGVD